MAVKTSKLARRLILAAAGVLLTILLLHLAGVALLRYFVEQQLHPALPRGTYIGDVHLNLFSGRLDVEDFELRNAGQVRMRFADLAVKVSPWRLLFGTLQVQKAVLRQAYVRVERREDGSFDLGLPPFGDEQPAPETDSEPPDLVIDGIDLQRIELDYTDGELRSQLSVERLQVGTYEARAATQQVPVEWRMRWDDRAIDGDARVTLAGDDVAAAGTLTTDLLDIGRAQQLARLQPAARGEVAYGGTFDWQAPRLRLAGRLQAPQLDYAADGQAAGLKELLVPQLAVDVRTEPTVDAKLTLGEPVTLASVRWQAGEQGADVAGLGIGGVLRFDAGRQVAIDDLTVSAERVAWSDAQRAAETQGIDLKGTLRQTLGEPSALPTLSAELSARAASFTETAQQLAVQLDALRVTELALDAADGQPGKAFRARLALGAGKATRDASKIDWSAIDAQLGGRLADTPSVKATATLDGLQLADPALPNGPLQLQQLVLQGLEQDAATRFERLSLRGIELPAEQAMTALTIAAVELGGGSFSEQDGVALGEIVIDGLQTGVMRNQAGAWRHVMSHGPAAAGPAQGAAPAQSGTATDGDAGLPWKIAGVRLSGDSALTVADALNPGMQPIRYALRKVEVGALSSAVPQQDTPFAVLLAPDKFSEFDIKGVVRPLAAKLYLKAEGHLHGFGLSSVNGLIANDLGHRFIEGQLDNDFTITIDRDRLEMGNALALAGLQVEEIEGKEGPPLSTAIALLEDRDGNIKLEVPVSGDLSDPDFRVLGALNPIIMKAVAGTAALAIQPLGSVLLVGSLLADQALKVSFEPALFAPGSTELDATASKYLGQLAVKLAEKPKLAVRICGVAVAAERRKDKQGKYIDTNDEVLAVAQRRADAARALLTAKGAGKKQLRRCRPAFDAKAEAKPRVDIKF